MQRIAIVFCQGSCCQGSSDSSDSSDQGSEAMRFLWPLLLALPLVLAIRDVHDNKPTVLEQAGPAFLAVPQGFPKVTIKSLRIDSSE